MFNALDDNQIPRQLYCFSHNAMATKFECCFLDEDRFDAAQAAQAVFEELDRLEQLLSCFIDSSDVSRFNRMGKGSLKVCVELLDCVEIAKKVHTQTNGAFDPTIGSLLTGRKPWNQDNGYQSNIQHVVEKTCPADKLNHIQYDPNNFMLTKTKTDVQLDLGGIAKGYALDQAALILQDWGIDKALIHSGQSTMLSLDSLQPDLGWPMRLLSPINEKDILGYCRINNMAISCSAQVKDKHIIDPKTGKTTERYSCVWVVAPTAVYADALSTAFMVMPEDQIARHCDIYENTAALSVCVLDNKIRLKKMGSWSQHHLKCNV